MGRNRAPDPNQPDLFSILDEAGGDGDRPEILKAVQTVYSTDLSLPEEWTPQRRNEFPDGRGGQDQLDGGQHGRGTLGESHRGLEPPAQQPDPESRDQGGAAAGSPGAGSADSAEQRGCTS